MLSLRLRPPRSPDCVVDALHQDYIQDIRQEIVVVVMSELGGMLQPLQTLWP